jgi:hypothetical protein
MRIQLMAEVAAKFEEIKASPWYKLRVKTEDLPKKLQEENPHITDVHELMNIEHYRPDAFGEMLRQILDSGGASTLKETGEQVIAASFLAAKSGSTSLMRDSDAISRKLIQLSGASTFPYQLIKTRKRETQIDFRQFHREMYVGHITNDQVMFTCYIVRKK